MNTIVLWTSSKFYMYSYVIWIIGTLTEIGDAIRYSCLRRLCQKSIKLSKENSFLSEQVYKTV